MFSTLLIANRGEIACRIIRTCRRLGIRSVAVYSETDANALHVQLADMAVPIGPSPARDSYLRADRIVEAALATGAQAIHPGYGFLSERLDLIAACEKHGIGFIGPSAAAIEAMGDKIRSKQIAREAGVPGVPGYDGADQAPETLKREALRIGLPVMVKASAGGGGKGIRKVENEADLASAITAASREAEAAFGDGCLLIEKFIGRPRHVEVQVAGDRHGHIVHLFERDCSVQRANQKLIEEAPAPHLGPETRAALHAHALTLARAISYDNLGTVEFLVDATTQEVFFLEMNTRLQVEHPVTEAITGLDLVEWQIRIAAGETLPRRQEEIACTGHAIEARLTAERADESFRPDTGTIALWREPEGLRIDSGVETGSAVSPFYDSMLAKIIAHGPDRDSARRKLAEGLERMTVLGPATIRPFLIDALQAPVFANGAATTLFIGETWPQGWQLRPLDEAARDAIAAAIWLSARGGKAAGPWGTLGGFRLLAPAGRNAASHLTLTEAGESRKLVVESREKGCLIASQGRSIACSVEQLGDRYRWRVLLDGRRFAVDAAIDREGVQLRFGSFEGRVGIGLSVEAAAAARQGGASAGDAVRATMPGTIAAIHVKEGDRVVAGQVVAVLESMKLFMDLKAPADAVVSRVAARSGKTAAAGELLIALTPG